MGNSNYFKHVMFGGEFRLIFKMNIGISYEMP